MKLPNSELAFVAKEKVDGYLLSVLHPVGGAKARWFNKMGYSPDDSELFQKDLLAFSKYDVVRYEGSEYGTKYVIMREIEGPSGESRLLTTVWIILMDDLALRLVTAYPGE